MQGFIFQNLIPMYPMLELLPFFLSPLPPPPMPPPFPLLILSLFPKM
jgi:hypothetical protein